MKLAVLADIHANFVALEAVAAHIDAWRPDQVVVAGDVVNRGPKPQACLNFVQQKVDADDWLLVRGNHEDYVLHQAREGANHTALEQECFQFSRWTYQQLNGSLSQLEMMPFQQSLEAPDGSEVRVVHASMISNRHGIFPRTTDDQLRAQIEPAPALFCVGHTHWPLIRHIDQTLVVNVGAVGLPFDRDTRPSYAQLTWHCDGWQTEIIRMEYDRKQAEQDFVRSGFLENGGPLAAIILDELQTGRSHLFSWTKQYQAAILAGEISMAEAVERFMKAL